MVPLKIGVPFFSNLILYILKSTYSYSNDHTPKKLWVHNILRNDLIPPLLCGSEYDVQNSRGVMIILVECDCRT